MSTCFVVQESDKNLMPAREFGEIHVMLTTADVKQGPSHCVSVLSDKMSNFRNAQDYLILVGDPVFIGVAMIFANQMGEGDFQILKWDRESYKYVPVDIRIP